MSVSFSLKRLIKLIVVSSLLVACTNERAAITEWQHSQLGSYAAAFSPDRRYVLVGDTDLPAKLWDIEAGKIKYAWQNKAGEAGTTTDVAFSHDGKVAATCESQTIVLWNMADGEPMVRLEFPATVKDMALSPQGDYVLLALQDRKAVYFDVIANRVKYIFEHDGKAVNAPINQLINTVAISPDGSSGLTGGDDNTARLWDLETGEQVQQWQHGNDVSLVSFDPLGGFVITAAGNDQTRLWNLKTGDQIAVLNNSPIPIDSSWSDFPIFQTTTSAIGYSADNQFIVTGHPNRQICTWQAQDGSPVDCWQAPRRQPLKPGVVLQAVTFSPDGKAIYSESGNGLAQKWQFQHD
ncbi:WD40 repeat domain-containing protein [Methylophaga sp.]|uniref:WD40 repeat domain-containing protein n=1 Tax=Methylophaga sp. TaxID=2024840 RepID=UPI003F69E632